MKSVVNGFFLLILLASGGWSFAESEVVDPKIIHFPVTSLRENEMLVVEARIDGLIGRPGFMRLYYRNQTDNSFDFVEMREGAGGFYGELAASKFSPPQMEYFILALLSDQKVITYPEVNPYGSPIVVNISGILPAPDPGVQPPPIFETPDIIPSETDTTAAQPFFEQDPLEEEFTGGSFGDSPILILSPEDGETFAIQDEVIIALSFLGEDSVNLKTVKLLLDGFNVTMDSEISEYLISYTAFGLQPGRHRIQVQGSFHSGLELPTTIWHFMVASDAPRIDRPPRVTGRVFAETRHENISDQGFSDNNVGGFLQGNYGVAKYDARVYLTTREDAAAQARNRYSLNLEIPILGVTLGDTYPRFNDLMLWGKRVRGIHARAHFGFLNLDFVQGEPVRRVARLVTDTTGTVLTNIAGSDSALITPRQSLLGARASFGSGRNFQLGFNFLKVRDDTTSFGPPHGIQILPKDNIVLGTDLLIGIANRRIEFRASAAASLVSNDISGGPLGKSEIEDQFDVDLPFDPADFSDFLIINSSTTPLDPRDLTSVAYQMGFRFNYFNHNLQTGYKSIGSDYTSLGNSFLRTNLRGFYINDRFRIFQNRLYLTLGFEHYVDNFDADDQNPSTNLNTLNTGFSFFPGAQYPSLTFNLRNHSRDNGIDSLFINIDGISTESGEDNETKDLSVQLNYNTRVFAVNHSISVGYISSDRDDRFTPVRQDSLLPSTETASNIQTFTVRTQYQVPLVTTITFARNDNNFSDGLNTFNFKMFGGVAQYYFLNRKLETHFGINFTSASGVTFSDSSAGQLSQITDYTRTLFNLGTRYELSPGHFFVIDGSLMLFSDNGTTFDFTTGLGTANPSFTDRLFRVYYEKRF